jgi:alkyldihydroxyacetonephosphate synthase
MPASHRPPDVGPGAPTPPIALRGDHDRTTARLSTAAVAVPDALVDRLVATGASVATDAATRVESSRDWWPLAMTWAGANQVGAIAGAVVRPDHVGQVSEIVALSNEFEVPITAAGGRSGVCGSSIPLYGGVVLDLCGLTGIRDVDDHSLTVDVLAGTFGDHFEAALRRDHDLTCGHWPQSMALATVGGWLACRGAGQLSTRYGKIEDMVIGLDVVLADGTVVHTGGNARQAVGPDLNQLFVGSEGTLGIITGARLRAHPAPTYEQRAAFSFPSFAAGIDACRRILRRGGRPAVLRLYDAVEGDRSYQTGDVAVLLVLDEGDPLLVDATMAIVDEECGLGGIEAEPLDEVLVERWLGHRNDVSQLQPLVEGGIVVDTMEVTAPWGTATDVYDAAVHAIKAVDGTLAASAHLSHSYDDGCCLYFTFAGKVDLDQRDRYYRAAWDAGTRAVLTHGGALSHHHGVGINRARFVSEALGEGLAVLASLKEALDPRGILNPGKLGLASPFGPNPFAGEEWPP